MCPITIVPATKSGIAPLSLAVFLGRVECLRPIHLSRLRIPGGDLDDLARLHAEWALGLGRFASLRDDRLAAGVPAETTTADLVDSQGGFWTFKFTLPERKDVSRSSAIRISRVADSVLVEHLVTREGPPELIVAPTAAVPEVVAWMLDKLPDIDPAPLRSMQSSTIDEPDVTYFVDQVLSPTRTFPIILVAVENASRATLVDGDELAKRLAGMATVYQLASVRVSYRLRDELVARNMPDKFGCYNGGVRILRPGIQSRDNPYDHLLLLPVRLTGLPAKSRTEQVAGIFCELIAEGEDPRRLLRELDPVAPPSPPPARPTRATERRSEPVQPLRSEPVQPLRSEPTRPRPREDASTLGTLGELLEQSATAKDEALAQIDGEGETDANVESVTCTSEGEQAEVEADASEVEGEYASVDEVSAPEPVLTKPTRRNSTWLHLADEIGAALQLAAEQEAELQALQSELEDAREQHRRTQRELDGLQGPPTTILEALLRAEAMYPEQLIVLRSARSSAADSPYRDPGRVLFILLLLANCDPSSFGEVLPKVAGSTARWKPRDSPETVAKFGKDRTFTDSTRTPKLFGRHVTLGHGVNSKKCLQIYYDVLGDGRIEIAWCGEHRPTVSEDT